MDELIVIWIYNQLIQRVYSHPLGLIEHYRTLRKESDFIVRNKMGEMLGIEVKASQYRLRISNICSGLENRLNNPNLKLKGLFYMPVLRFFRLEAVVVLLRFR